MSWVKMDDQFPSHPKVAMLGEHGPLAGWLYVAGVCRCSQYLTDGFIPEAWVPTLAVFPRRVKPADLAAMLVSVGLWERVDGGYRVHDYLEYNPSRDRVRELRASWARRQTKSRGDSQAESRQVSRRDSPSPVPVPHKSTLTSAPRASDGLPYLTTGVAEAWQEATGRSALASGDWAARMLDELVERQGEDAVVKAIPVVRSSFERTPSPQQLAAALRNRLEPLPRARDQEKAERETETSAQSARRVISTKRAIHGYGGHQANPDPSCPECAA